MKILNKDVQSLTKEITEWLKNENLFDELPYTDLVLTFLEGCKYRTDVTKRKIKNYLEVRKTTPEWYENRDPSLLEIKRLLQLGVFLPLPHKDEENRYTILVRATIHDPQTIPISHVYKIGMMVLDLLLANDHDVSKNGVNVLIDLSGVSFGHVYQMTPFLVKKTVFLWQDCYPIRFKTLNFVNCPYFVGWLINLMKNFMTQKLKKRVKVHGSYDELHGVLDPSRLPEEYGGTDGKLEPIKDDWDERINSKKEWFLDRKSVV